VDYSGEFEMSKRGGFMLIELLLVLTTAPARLLELRAFTRHSEM
jgi:hypothetical protein